MLPLEFTVTGTPISAQASYSSRRRWKSEVRAAALNHLPSGIQPVQSPVRLIVVYFYAGAHLDLDNMLKPLVDALNGLVYLDDTLVTDITALKRDLFGTYKLSHVPPVLVEALTASEEFVYLRIEHTPDPPELDI